MPPASSPVPSLLPERRRPARTGVTVARALGSTTRAAIYEHLQDAGAPLTVRDVAGQFDLHPNVARTHLELLADAGLVTVGRRKHPGGGRPAKVYRALDDGEPGGAHHDVPVGRGAAELIVRLLAALAEDRAGPSPPGRTPAQALQARAHEAAVAEGRRLVGELAGRPDLREVADADASALERAAAIAVRALQPYATQFEVVGRGEDWVDLSGLRQAFELLEDIRPGLVDPLERGLVAGAMAAAGATVALSDAGTAAGGRPVLRARAVAVPTPRATPAPSASVDTRGQHREAGVVGAMRSITALQPGEVLEVLAEGPGSPAAFARWADRAGHELLGVERATDATGRPAIRLLIRKGG